MIFIETGLPGAYLIELDLIEDDRGFFARSFCQEEFQLHGLNPNMVQCNISYNKKKGTLRGMHFQMTPHQEAKLVRCTRGRIFDVIVDLRERSAAYLRWYAVELSADKRNMLYIPEGFAHGFQTLEDDSEVFYQMSANYHAGSATGVRWNDPLLGIEWPVKDVIMSAKDAKYPDIAQQKLD